MINAQKSNETWLFKAQVSEAEPFEALGCDAGGSCTAPGFCGWRSAAGDPQRKPATGGGPPAVTGPGRPATSLG
jgi:hypothetical protein